MLKLIYKKIIDNFTFKNFANLPVIQFAPQYNRLTDMSDKFENHFSYFSTKTYVVSTQKNGLNETVLLSTQNIC